MTVPGERTEAQLAIIEALKGMPRALEQETAGVSDAVLRYRPAEGEYSIKEIAGHLRDMAQVWHTRLSSIWSMTDPRFMPFDGEASVRDHNYQDADVNALIAGVEEWRSKTADLLAKAVDWTRLGQHPEMGRRSLRQWAEFVIEHDREHLEKIRELKEAQTAARLP